MRKGLRAGAAALAVSIVAMLAPLGAHAGFCDSNLVIFSSPVGLNTNAAVCVVDPGIDTRLINPGSSGVSVRYIVDLGATIPAINVVLNGMGFTNKMIDAKRAAATGGGFVYDTAVVSFPAGNAAAGCLSAVAYDKADTEFIDPLDNVTFHTIDQQVAGCP